MPDVTSCKNALWAAQHAAVIQVLVFCLYSRELEPNARLIGQLHRAIYGEIFRLDSTYKNHQQGLQQVKYIGNMTVKRFKINKRKSMTLAINKREKINKTLGVYRERWEVKQSASSSFIPSILRTFLSPVTTRQQWAKKYQNKSKRSKSS